MSSKCCSNCRQTRLLSSFLLDPSKPAIKELKTYAPCRVSIAKSREKLKEEKRNALQPLDPNIPAKKRVLPRAKTLARPEPPLPEVVPSIHVPSPPFIQPPLPRSEPSLLTRPPVLPPAPLRPEPSIRVPTPPRPQPSIRILTPPPPPPGFLPPDQ
jgi:hypothetical protein